MSAGADVGRAWRELVERRQRAITRHRAWLAAAVVPALAAVVAVSALAGSQARVRRGTAGHQDGQVGIVVPQPGNAIPLPGVDPAAVVARLPLSGVISLTAAGTDLWAVRATERRGSAPSYQLVRINARTGRIALRVDLGPQQPAVAAGRGAVWVTTGAGRATGQIARLDPVTGRLVSTLHLPAAGCGSVVYGAGQLFVDCRTSDPATTTFLRVNPATGRTDGRAGPVLGAVAAVVVPGGLWYSSPVGLVGLLGFGGRAHQVGIANPGFLASFARTQSLGFADGYLWVLTGDGSVATIDPATGNVRRSLTYGSFGPADPAGPQAMAVGQGSLWLLVGAGQFGGVLRVSVATGRPVGLAGIPAGSCAQECSQIYDLAGAVWVPTSRQLIEISPALMPAEPVFSISAQRAEGRSVRHRGLWFCDGPCH